MTDQNRKTLRSFYCRDYLWELFEQMTHELGCSMDYLINESMRLYARSRDFPAEGQQGAPGQAGGFGAPANPPVDRFNVGYQQGPMAEHRTFDRIQPVGPGNRPMPPQPQPNPFGAPAAPAPPAPPAPVGPPQGGMGGMGGLASSPPPPPPRPGQQSAGWGQPAPGGRQTLYLTFNNQRYPVDKDKFVIGRGTQQTDLTIRDGNISRKHCAVIFHNGAYYIKDMGSTNGIEFKNNRIESKKIDDGDVFYLCDYELRFSYH